MEIRNEEMLYLAGAICLVLSIVFLIKTIVKQKYNKGIKAANLDILMADNAFRVKKIEYYILRFLLWGSIMGVIISSCLILARPYIVKQSQEKKYSRDIIICLDVSTSVNKLNMKLTKELQNTMRDLKGERVGIVIFNSSPVLVSPLTDDYQYTINMLEKINHSIKVTDASNSTRYDDWYSCSTFLFGGTLVGNKEHGSSLIGDGLLGAAFNFPKYEKDRTKVIIFATDNDLYGDPYVSIMEAADICAKNDIIVYGLGTELMTQKDKDEMQAAMEKTGGKFYLEEDTRTFSSIVDDIDKLSAGLVKGKTIIKEIESPFTAFKWLIICLVLSIILMILLRIVSVPRALRIVTSLITVLAIGIMYIYPALNNDYGEETDMKADSDLNVLILVDTTMSMIAEDYNGDMPRLDGVKEDLSSIIDELDGAKISLVSFNNSAEILTPYNINGDHVKNMVYSLYPMGELYARGTNMNVVKSTMTDILTTSAMDPDQKTVVFFVSDGEITSDEMLDSYKELAPYISGGAVLGYGTEEGGKMYYLGPYDEEPSVIMDNTSFPYSEAISRIDEDNLNRIADDMGIRYINMNNKKGLSDVLFDIKKQIHVSYSIDKDKKEEEKNETVLYKFENNWWMLAYLVLAIYVFEGISICWKKR